MRRDEFSGKIENWLVEKIRAMSYYNMKNLTEQVLKTVRHYDMLGEGDSITAAVSGGADSVFLLSAMSRLKTKLKIKKLVVANLDHGLRGAESKADSDFVKKLARDLELKFIHEKISLKDMKSKKLSTEEAAREARYAFLKEAAKKSCCNVIATGHTLDDQAETVLMRIVQGSSLKGIVGIAPVREEGSIKIIRPCLQIEKTDIESYLKENGIEYRVDSSNLEPVYFRNIIRAQILPFLEKYNPRIKRVLFNLCEHLREDFDFIEKAKADLKRELSRRPRRKGVTELALKDIVIQPRALQKEILRDMLQKAGGEVKRLSYRHWMELEQLLKTKRRGSSVDLPGNIRATRTSTAISFNRL